MRMSYLLGLLGFIEAIHFHTSGFTPFTGYDGGEASSIYHC